MFEQIRYRLVLSYLAVLTVILTTFAIAVRVTFARTLHQQLINRLETLARAAALELELEDGELEVDNEPLAGSNQGIQWFDAEGNLLEQQGDNVLELPFEPKQAVQTQALPSPATGITIRINDDDTNVFVGYARVSESTQNLLNAQRSLDIGLGVGAIAALGLSGIGSIWLTRKSMQPIEESFERLKQFTADASHELRNPLMAIKSNAAVALKYPHGMRDTDREKFSAIASATNQMTRLTEDLLLLARSDRRANYERTKVNLTEILKELVELHKPSAIVKKITFQAQIDDRLFLQGDSSALAQAFTNIVQNALQYTPSGGQVTVTAYRDSQIRVSIKDTGIGIAPEHLNKIFERFWQARPSRSYGERGAGLGLAIAQAIISQHSGTIAVTSQLGRGTCFTVRLNRSR